MCFFQYRVSIFLYYTILSYIIILSYYIYYILYYTPRFSATLYYIYYLVPPQKTGPMMPLADAPVAQWPLPASPRPPATGQLSGLGPGYFLDLLTGKFCH
jgi:hypothetical protein